jgi:hypothetical protein
MDNNTVLVVAIALFVLVIVVALLKFGKRVSGSIEGPAKTKLSIDASNPDPEATQGAAPRRDTSRNAVAHAPARETHSAADSVRAGVNIACEMSSEA